MGNYPIATLTPLLQFPVQYSVTKLIKQTFYKYICDEVQHLECNVSCSMLAQHDYKLTDFGPSINGIMLFHMYAV